MGDAFRYAFKKFQENLLPLILITLAIIVAVAIIQGVGNLVQGAVVPDRVLDPETLEWEGGGGGFFGIAFFLSILFSALSMAINLVIQAGIIKAALAVTRGQKVDLGSAFNGVNWGQVVLAALLVAALTFVGLLFCFVGAIPVAIFTSFTMWFVIDRNQDAITALKSSFTMVKDNFGPLLLFFLASLAAIIVGTCLCGVGLLAAIPIVILAQAYTFRTLNNDPVTA